MQTAREPVATDPSAEATADEAAYVPTTFEPAYVSTAFKPEYDVPTGEARTAEVAIKTTAVTAGESRTAEMAAETTAVAAANAVSGCRRCQRQTQRDNGG